MATVYFTRRADQAPSGTALVEGPDGLLRTTASCLSTDVAVLFMGAAACVVIKSHRSTRVRALQHEDLWEAELSAAQVAALDRVAAVEATPAPVTDGMPAWHWYRALAALGVDATGPVPTACYGRGGTYPPDTVAFWGPRGGV